MSQPTQKKKIIVISAVILILGVMLIITFQPNSLFGNNSATISLVHYVVWLIVIIASAIVHFQKNVGKAVRYATLWVLIGSLLFVGYNLRDEFKDFGARLKAELIPHSGRQSTDQIEFKAQMGGHFVIEAKVDGFEIRFLVDTGASDVILTPRDAKKIGFDDLRASQLKKKGNLKHKRLHKDKKNKNKQNVARMQPSSSSQQPRLINANTCDIGEPK